jgi:hypothetical protein
MMLSRLKSSQDALLTAQAGLSSAAFCIECCILFTLIAFDRENGTWGSFYLFSILCAPYSIASLLSGNLWRIFCSAKTVAFCHAANGIALIFVIIFFENPTILWGALFLKSCLRGISTVAEMQYVQSTKADNDLIEINSLLQVCRQSARFSIPIVLMIFSSSILSLAGLKFAAILFLLSAILSVGMKTEQIADNLPILENKSGLPDDLTDPSRLWASKRLALFSVFAIVFFDSAVNTIYPQLAASLGFPRTIMSESLMLTGIGGIIGSSIVRRLRSRKVAILIVSVAAIGGSSIPLLTHLSVDKYWPSILFRIALIISGASLSAIFIVATANLQGISSKFNSTNDGALRTFLVGIASIFGPLCAAACSQAIGFVATMWILGSATALSTFCVALKSPRSKFHRNNLLTKSL